jgi:putative redox protein
MIKSTSTETNYHCILSNDKMTLESDAPVFKGGLGNGFRPHELLEGALASCINISIRMIAKEKNIDIGEVETMVEVEKTDTKTIFNYKIKLDDKLNADDKKYLMGIIDQCAIKQTLSKQLEFNLNEKKNCIKLHYNLSRMWI